jgi:serine/threonine-protein kinase
MNESTIAHYKITGKLGEGGMGAVYRATDTKLAREVAIKVIPESFANDADRLARFTREAQVLASLNHPNIAAVYGVEERAIVLELVEGQTLSGPLTEEEALPLIQQLIDALEYAHEKGIIHRDLKPANIKVTPEGRLKVLDFGLAKALSSEAAVGASEPANSPTMTMRATMAGVIMGTAGYMSPEQARGQAVDRRADIWSFGVVVFEMLTGRALFEGETVSDTLAAVLRQDPNIDNLPVRFRRLLRLCLARDARQRLRDISGARLLLEESGDPRPAALASTSASTSSTGRSTGWIAATAVCAVLAAIAGGIAWRATRPVEKPLMRLSVDLGEEAYGDPVSVFAFSPDGRRVAYMAHTAEGKRMLATREFAQNKVTLLRGTEDAMIPFFSPDGEWIGFFAGQKLMKVAAEGGAPVIVADDIKNPRGASWGEDGNIVMAMTPSTGLTRVSAAGGTVQTLTNPAAKGQMTHRWPQILTGGRTVIFTCHVMTSALDDAEICALDLKSGQWKTVQKGGYFGRYLPSGHLVYTHLGQLFAVRFDKERLETKGTPVVVLEDLAANRVSAAGRFDFAAEAGAGIFGYMSGRSDIVASRLMWLDASGKTEAVGAGAPQAPEISPDGNLLAGMSGSIASVNVRVWDMRRDVTTSITNKAADYQAPIWAPDGRHLVYGLYADGVGQLLWARSDGATEPRKLTEGKSPLIPYSFSPDGKHLAYTLQEAGYSADLWTLPLDLRDPENPKAGTPEVFLRTPQAEIDASFSPDGKWIAYSSQEAGAFEVYVRPFPGPGGRWQVSAGDGVWPQWSRTGRQILYVTTTGRIMAADYEIRGDTFVAGKARLWSETRVNVNIGLPYFKLAAEGKRVLTYINPADTAENNTSVHVTMLLNFFDELKRRLP